MDISRIAERLTAIESRLTALENRQLPPLRTKRSTPVAPEEQAVAAVVSKESVKSGNWLGSIAIICFVLAAGFIIKLSIDSGWLTPARQIGLAALFGFSLIGAGLLLLRADHEYASFLPGGGVIVLYLAAFAAHRYHALIPLEAALAVTGGVSALCIGLYTRIRHDIYPITAAVGAYLSPVVLSLGTATEFSPYYFLLCSIAFAVISVWVQSRLLTIMAAYLAILITAVAQINLEQNILIAVTLALHFLLFATGSYCYTRYHRTPLTSGEAWAFLPILLLFYVVEYGVLERINAGLAPWISLGFAGFLLVLYFSARRYFPDNLNSQSLILAFASLVVFHSAYLELLPDMVRPWLGVLIVLAAAMLPRSAIAPQTWNPFCIPLVALGIVVSIEYIRIFFHLFMHDYINWLPVALVLLTAFWMALGIADETFSTQRTYGQSILTAAHVLAVLSLYRLTGGIGSLAVSASWLCYAVGVMALAFHRRDAVMAKSALFVLAFAAAKALLYDAASAAMVIRIFCLLLTGAVLYSCGLLMRQMASWRQE